MCQFVALNSRDRQWLNPREIDGVDIYQAFYTPAIWLFNILALQMAMENQLG